jgi:hypothetical protein
VIFLSVSPGSIKRVKICRSGSVRRLVEHFMSYMDLLYKRMLHRLWRIPEE